MVNMDFEVTKDDGKGQGRGEGHESAKKVSESETRPCESQY